MTEIKNTLKIAAILLATVSCASLASAGDRAAYPSYSPDLMPPSPNPGMCYARVEIPAQYSTSTERVVVEEGYTTTQAVQGQLVPGQERVMVKEASVRYDVKQPSFQSVPQKIMVRPSYEKLFISKPQFDNVKETVNSAQPTLVWKRGNPGKLISQGYKIHSTADGGVSGRGYSSVSDYSQNSQANTQCGDTCEIWCLVEEPGETVSFNRRVMKSPGNIRRQSVPAKFQTVMKQVVSDPGGVREIPVPAEFTTINVERIAQSGGVRQVNVPPKYGDVATKKLVSASRYEWRQVVCKPGTGSIRSSQSYAQPITPAIVTPVASAPSYTTSSYSQGSSYSAPATHYGSQNYDQNTGYYESGQSCSGTTCVNAGVHSQFEGRSRGHSGSQSHSSYGSSHSDAIPASSELNNHGYISDAYELPTPTSNNLGGYPSTSHTGSKRSRW